MRLLSSASSCCLLAIAVALAIYISKGSANRRRTLWLCLALMLVAFVGFVLWGLASITYIWPMSWIVGVSILAVGAVVLIVIIGRDVRFRPLRLVAVAGLVLMAAIMFGNLVSWNIEYAFTEPLYVTRAEQIAKANGFNALLAPDQHFAFDYGYLVGMPPGSKEGLQIDYEDAPTVQERKASGASVAELKKLVEPGARPYGGDSDIVIPADASVTTLTVQGQPAVAAEWTFIPPEAVKPGAVQSVTNHVLVFELDGVEVRVFDEAEHMDSGAGQRSETSLDDVVRFAESLRAAE